MLTRSSSRACPPPLDPRTAASGFGPLGSLVGDILSGVQAYMDTYIFITLPAPEEGRQLET